MKPLGGYAVAASKVGGSEVVAADGPVNNIRCIVAGCPLPGGISESTRGGGPWFCRFHFNTDGSEREKITAHINERRSTGDDLILRGDSATVRDMKTRVKARPAAE